MKERLISWHMIYIVVASITNQILNLIEFSGGSLLDIRPNYPISRRIHEGLTLKNGELFTTNVE